VIFLAGQVTLHVLRLSTLSVIGSKKLASPPVPNSANNPMMNQVIGFMERHSLPLRMFRDDIAWYLFTIGVCIILAWLVPL